MGDWTPSSCAWTVELEVFRTCMALLAVALSFKMFEVFALFETAGVLTVMTSSMFFRMLNWLPLVLLLCFGSAVAMNVLAPQYRLEHSPGALNLPWEGFTGDFSAGGPFF